MYQGSTLFAKEWGGTATLTFKSRGSLVLLAWQGMLAVLRGSGLTMQGLVCIMLHDAYQTPDRSPEMLLHLLPAMFEEMLFKYRCLQKRPFQHWPTVAVEKSFFSCRDQYLKCCSLLMYQLPWCF